MNDIYYMKRIIYIFAIFALISLYGVSPVGADRGSSGAVIAIIDSGILPREEGRLWSNPGEIPDNGLDDDNNGYPDDIHGWNFWENSNDLWDFSGTGTEYATIVENSCEDCRIMPIKIDSVEYAPALARAIHYAADNKADVISISTLWRDNSDIEEAVNYAQERGTIIVASASYEFLSMTYPATYSDVIAVTSVDKDETVTYGSYIYAMDEWGLTPYVDFVVPLGNYAKSAPYLAGVIGEILSDGEIPPGRIKEHLCENSYDILDPFGDGSLMVGADEYTGCGKIER